MFRFASKLLLYASAIFGAAMGVLVGIQIGCDRSSSTIICALVFGVTFGLVGLGLGGLIVGTAHVVGYFTDPGKTAADGPEADYDDRPRLGPPTDPRL